MVSGGFLLEALKGARRKLVRYSGQNFMVSGEMLPKSMCTCTFCGSMFLFEVSGGFLLEARL